MARVEAPRFNNTWEDAGRALQGIVDGFKFAVTRGLLRESLLNYRSYYRIWDRTPISTALRPLVQHLTQKVTNLVRRIP